MRPTDYSRIYISVFSMFLLGSFAGVSAGCSVNRTSKRSYRSDRYASKGYTRRARCPSYRYRYGAGCVRRCPAGSIGWHPALGTAGICSTATVLRLTIRNYDQMIRRVYYRRYRRGVRRKVLRIFRRARTRARLALRRLARRSRYVAGESVKPLREVPPPPAGDATPPPAGDGPPPPTSDGPPPPSDGPPPPNDGPPPPNDTPASP